MIVNLFIQLIVAFTRKGWYLYFAVAAYAIYKGVKFLMDMTGGMGGEEVEEEGAKKKKDKRRDRDEQPKQKIKYIKH